MSRSQNPTLRAALEHAERGTRVGPLAARTKRPLLKALGDGNRGGVHMFTTDAVQIQEWWSRWPNANLGLATGVSDDPRGEYVFDVVDIDARSIRFLSAEAQRLLLPLAETVGPLVRTPHGWHYYVKAGGIGNPVGVAREELPPGVERRPGSPPLARGFDVRGAGGFVVAPPSINETGAPYLVQRPYDSPLPDFPPGIIAAVEIARRASPVQTVRVPAERRRVGSGEGTDWGLAALNREIGRLRAATPGSRNDTLNSAAFKLFQVANGGQLTDEVVRRELGTAATDIGMDKAEIDKTIGSAADGASRAGPRSPRGGGGLAHRGPSFGISFVPTQH